MLKINNECIGENHPPFLIAEISGNHNGSLLRLKELIYAAKISGAHAVKIQTYTPDTMTIDSNKPDFIIKNGLWSNYNLYNLYKEAHTPYEWHYEIFNYAKEIGLTIFSTPFDESAVDLLESLDTPAYKIASFELTDLPLISYVAKTGKPMLLSTGMASENEITEALDTALNNGCNSILLFHCVSSYPTPVEQINLNKIKLLQKTFKVPVGLSDHTLGNVAAIASIGLGACAIEKHFTLNRNEKGPDSEFSIEPNELNILAKDINNAWLALGEENFFRPKPESDSKIFRRSIYFVENIIAGEIVTTKHIRRIRPGFGIPSKYFNQIIGKKVKRNCYRGEPVTWDAFE